MSILRADSIRDRAGTGAPDFPNGLTGTLTGNVTGTATTATLANTATVATNAQGLTGTPSITVTNVTGNNGTFSGDISGVNATFSGNLTVNGTTTTIDTAVTAVDSLAVDGSVGIGTTNPATSLEIGNGHIDPVIRLNDPADRRMSIRGPSANNIASVGTESSHSLAFFTNGYSNERLRIDQHGTSKFKGPLTEKCNRDTGGGLTGNYNHDLLTYGNVHWATSNSAGTWTYNLRGSSTVALNDMMSDGETLSFQLISAQNNASYYMTQFRIDGTAHTVWWQGGSAPSAGGGSGYDVYTFTVFKIGNASFRTFASLSNHA